MLILGTVVDFFPRRGEISRLSPSSGCMVLLQYIGSKLVEHKPM